MVLWALHSMVGQAAARPADAGVRAAVAVGALIALVMVLGVVLLWARKRLFAKGNALSDAAGLSDQLRDMHARGRMTTEEYDRVRKSMARKAAQRSGAATIAKPRPDNHRASGPSATENESS